MEVDEGENDDDDEDDDEAQDNGDVKAEDKAKVSSSRTNFKRLKRDKRCALKVI